MTSKTLTINHKLVPFLVKPQQIKVAIGGRGSGKSIGVGDMLTFKMDTEKADIYCLREFQDSITDSVHRVFADSIEERLNLQGWEIQEKRIIAPNGATTTYKGANRNPDSMQSAQGYKYSWVEEAHRLSQASIDKLLPTILRNPGAQCWFTANPQSSGDPFSQRFIVPYIKELERDGYYEDDLHYIVMVNWRDNPWWNKEQEALRSWDYENLPRAKYDWIWEGKFLDTVEDAIIQSEWFDACIDAHEKLGFRPKGKKVIAHDPSDMGADSKGLAYRHGVVFLDVREKITGDVNDGLDWATDYAIENKVQVFTWDADGLGAALRRQISDNFIGHDIQQLAFKGSQSVDYPDRQYEPTIDNAAQPLKNEDVFKNKRAQWYWNLRDRVYRTYRAVTFGEYYDPDTLISFSSDIKDLQSLRSEVCRIPRKPNGVGLIQIMSKPEMRKNDIPSPNMADSVMMCLSVSDSVARKEKRQPPRMKVV